MEAEEKNESGMPFKHLGLLMTLPSILCAANTAHRYRKFRSRPSPPFVEVYWQNCVVQKIPKKNGGSLASKLAHKTNDSGECSQG